MALDNFTRANETPLGTGWTATTDWFGRASHQLAVNSNHCVAANAAAGNSGSAVWTTSPTSADQWCSIVVGAKSGDTNAYYILGIRLINVGTSNVSGYTVNVGGTGNIIIGRMDNGTITDLTDTGVSWAATDTIKLDATGSTITAYKNGVSAGTATDSTYTVAGKIGLLLGPGPNSVGDTYVTSFDGSPFAPANTVAPAVSGSAPVGSTLSCTTGTWTDDGSPAFTYQWWRDTNASPIGGATSSTYTTVGGDATHAVGCTVTDTDSHGATAKDSSNTVTVTAASSGQRNRLLMGVG